MTNVTKQWSLASTYAITTAAAAVLRRRILPAPNDISHSPTSALHSTSYQSTLRGFIITTILKSSTDGRLFIFSRLRFRMRNDTHAQPIIIYTVICRLSFFPSTVSSFSLSSTRYPLWLVAVVFGAARFWEVESSRFTRRTSLLFAAFLRRYEYNPFFPPVRHA